MNNCCFNGLGGLGLPNSNDGGTDDIEVITATTTAASSRNVQEVQARIAAAGGALIVGPNSSDYIVAVNNRLKFSVTRRADGQFEIKDSSNYWLVIGVAVIAGAVLISRSR